MAPRPPPGARCLALAAISATAEPLHLTLDPAIDRARATSPELHALGSLADADADADDADVRPRVSFRPAASASRTQQQAMMTAAFVFLVPQIYLSGLLFPIENMPRAFQLATYAVPLRYYAQILRGVFLKGAGIESLWPQALALAVFEMAFLTLAALRFRKRLD